MMHNHGLRLALGCLQNFTKGKSAYRGNKPSMSIKPYVLKMKILSNRFHLEKNEKEILASISY